MQQMTPKQVFEHIQRAEAEPVLLDVREPSEVEICALENSISIPLQQISTSLDQLDPDQEHILICHHGIRSHRAGNFLAHQGFEKLINLAGGMEAWACDLDPQVNRY